MIADYKQTAKYAVKDELYHDLKADHDLTANLVQQAIFQAVEAIKSGVERLEKNEDTSQPEFTADTARYDKRAATFHTDHVSLSTVDGRIEADTVGYNFVSDSATTGWRNCSRDYSR